MERTGTQSIWQKLVRADSIRKTRFHDLKGNLVNAGGLVYLPHAYLTSGLKRVGYRPSVPWISYRARREIARIIRPDWRIIEFGSGGSTAWLAARCGSIHSIESNPAWFLIVKERLAKAHKNVRYELRVGPNYADLNDYADRSVDFALIDGEVRSQCAANVLRTIKPGGFIYLDNSDRAIDHASEEGQAEHSLLNAMRGRGGRVRYFVDYAPSLAAPSQGMLVRLD
ncbi:MAG TPA: class I SAM-dependent methyltransferase [Candidatus Binataceae bacterium]|nr:class I SAM-dependent methyltransferase [Candidatus Binataceae bacterium]